MRAQPMCVLILPSVLYVQTSHVSGLQLITRIKHSFYIPKYNVCVTMTEFLSEIA
jgi:hypothetical protein